MDDRPATLGIQVAASPHSDAETMMQLRGEQLHLDEWLHCHEQVTGRWTAPAAP
jgi:hypothetical protein